MGIKTIRNIQYQATRPTSVTVMLFLFQTFKMMFPDKIGPDGNELVYGAITIIGATGLLEKVWDNKDDMAKWIKKVFTNKLKKDGKFKESS
jgi:hypothetical protein